MNAGFKSRKVVQTAAIFLLAAALANACNAGGPRVPPSQDAATAMPARSTRGSFGWEQPHKAGANGYRDQVTRRGRGESRAD